MTIGTLPRIGETLAGKYELVGILGEGGMASVFEAMNAVDRAGPNERVAVKILAPELARDPSLVARFQREARALRLLKTRHVAHVIDVDVTDAGIPFIVMEFLEGRDLEAELEARGALPLGEVVDYLLQASAAIMDAHASGIIHRDLKPANLFVAHGAGGERIVKVLDFGISKMVGESTRLTGAGAVMGTVLYMPPEQIRATTNVDLRADVWSVGVILFELLAGRPPWEGAAHKVAAEIVSSDAPDIRKFAPTPDGVADAIRKMLQRDRDRRFSSITEVVRALAPFAPAGSLGASIANEVLLSSARMRVTTPVLVPQGSRQPRTVPLGLVPPPPVAPQPPPSQKTVPMSAPPASTRSAASIPPAPSSQRTAFLLGFFLMLAIAGGVLFAIVFIRKGRVSPTTTVTLASAPASTPALSLALSPSSAPSSPAPPTTGTTTAARPTATAAREGDRSGPAAASATPAVSRSAPQPVPPTPSAPTTNGIPTHL